MLIDLSANYCHSFTIYLILNSFLNSLNVLFKKFSVIDRGKQSGLTCSEITDGLGTDPSPTG